MSRSTRNSPPGFFGTLWRMLLVGTAMFAICAVGGYAAVYRMVRSPETEAPDLLALDVAEAVTKASSEGFAIRVAEREASDVLDRGEVLSQRPLPGDWVKQGTTIVLTVAE